MPIAERTRACLGRGSWIRRMYEAGVELRARLGAEAVFDFSLGNPALAPPPEFVAALRSAALSEEPGTHAYMTNAGYPFARAEMARKVSEEHDVAAGAEDVVMTVGAAGALNVILRALVDPGDEVVVVRPYFAEYTFYAENHGAQVRVADSGPGFSLDAEAVARVLSPRTACVIINSPNNPTGRVYPRADIEALAGVLSAHGRRTGRAPYLVVDEPYRDIVYDGLVAPPVLSAYPESLVASSFSKTLSIPGERLGYVAVNPACADKAALVAGLTMANRVLGFVNAPALMQRAVAASWRAKADVSRYARRRDLMTSVLRDAGLRYAEPEGAFYLFCEAPQGPRPLEPDQSSDVAFALALKDRGVLAVPGVGFGYPGWLRLCYCVPEEVIEGSREAFMRTAADFGAC